MNRIAVFTDGSTHYDKYENKYLGCAGALSNDVEYKLILDKCTNNICELMSILIGLVEVVAKGQHLDNEIYLFTDSKICMMSLSDWVFNWHKNSETEIYQGVSGKPVVNQEIIKYIINFIIVNNIHIRFFHQKGHVNRNSYSSVSNSIKVFKESNNIDITLEFAKYLAIMNDRVDTFTKIELRRYLKHKKAVCIDMDNVSRSIRHIKLTDSDFIKYNKLLLNSKERIL